MGAANAHVQDRDLDRIARQVACQSAELLQSCPTRCDPMNCVAHQASLSMGFYWSGLSFLPPGYFPNLGTEPVLPASLALAGGFFTSVPPGG